MTCKQEHGTDVKVMHNHRDCANVFLSTVKPLPAQQSSNTSLNSRPTTSLLASTHSSPFAQSPTLPSALYPTLSNNNLSHNFQPHCSPSSVEHSISKPMETTQQSSQHASPQTPCFNPSVPLRTPTTPLAISPRSPRRQRTPIASSAENIPNSPATLLRSWRDSRTIASTIDLSRRFISVLFLSNHCQRAAYAEKQLAEVAERYSISRRLLILSAGIHSSPGDLLPWRLVQAAQKRGIDLSDERPCASFDITDLEYYDFVVVVDRDVKEQILRMAEAFAQSSGGHLYEWERKIRLLCNFDGAVSERGPISAGVPLDVPHFNAAKEVQTTMDIICSGCESIARSLLVAGL